MCPKCSQLDYQIGIVPDYMADDFTTTQLEEFKEAFALFDSTSVGSVPLEVVGTIVRSLGNFVIFSFLLTQLWHLRALELLMILAGLP